MDVEMVEVNVEVEVDEEGLIEVDQADPGLILGGEHIQNCL